MSEPSFEIWKKQAVRLTDLQLERHCRVARLEGAERCKSCFCCAAEEVLNERKGKSNERP